MKLPKAAGGSLALELLGQLRGLELRVEESDLVEEPEHSRHRVVCRIPAPAVGGVAFGLIYALGALSFHDAEARGASLLAYRERDEWTPEDMIRGLVYDGGDLRFDADYVRGRMMKTRVRVRGDGTVVVSTINRGDAAARWIDSLRGKPRVSLAPEEGSGT